MNGTICLRTNLRPADTLIVFSSKRLHTLGRGIFRLRRIPTSAPRKNDKRGTNSLPRRDQIATKREGPTHILMSRLPLLQTVCTRLTPRPTVNGVTPRNPTHDTGNFIRRVTRNVNTKRRLRLSYVLTSNLGRR